MVAGRPLSVRTGPTGAPLDVGGEGQRDVGLGAGTAGAGVRHRFGEPFAARGVGEGECGRPGDDGRRTVLAIPREGPTEAGRHVAGGVPGVALPADGRRSMGPRRPVGVGAADGHAGEARAEVVGESLRSARRVDVGRLDQAVGAVVTVGPALARPRRGDRGDAPAGIVGVGLGLEGGTRFRVGDALQPGPRRVPGEGGGDAAAMKILCFPIIKLHNYAIKFSYLLFKSF